MSNLENIDSIINEMSDSVNEIISFKEGYQKLNEMQTSLQEGIAFLNENKDCLNNTNAKFDDLHKVISDNVISELNTTQEELKRTKQELVNKCDALNSRAQNLENTFAERANQIQERITNQDSNFTNKLGIVQERIANLETSINNKFDGIKNLLNTLQGELEKEHSNISNQIIDFEANIKKQQVEFKECIINEINISKKNSKVYFVTTMVFLFIILGICAYILYILLNPVLA